MSDLPKDTTTQKGAPATNSSEFAEKQPLVTQTSLRKWGLIISGFVGFLVILGASIFAFSNIINRVPQIINEPIDEPEPVVDDGGATFGPAATTVGRKDGNIYYVCRRCTAG